MIKRHIFFIDLPFSKEISPNKLLLLVNAGVRENWPNKADNRSGRLIWFGFD